MIHLPDINRLSPVAREELVAAFDLVKTYEGCGKEVEIKNAVEKLADLLNQYGLHEESRHYYHDLELSATSPMDKSRLLRKVSLSHIAQRQLIKAQSVAEQALGLLRHVNQGESNTEEFFEALIACALSNYFISNRQRHDELIKEMKQYFPAIANQSLKIHFYYAIVNNILLRYRWYMLPEESITHAEFYMQLALQTKNRNTIATAYSTLGFIHLWREEFELCRKALSNALDLLHGRNLEIVLMSQIYTTVSYRMQSNLPLTEKWALMSMEVAKQAQNELYLALSYGCLAWVNVKRNNWLYAEDYARKGIGIIIPFRFPMIYLCLFPLLACLHKNGKYGEAGMYCFLLLHPSMKRLPDTLNKKLQRLNVAWSINDEEETKACLEDVLTEARLTNYF